MNNKKKFTQMNTELFCHKTYHDDFFQVHLIPSLTLTKSEYFDIENGDYINLYIFAVGFLVWDFGFQITKNQK
jgi:hypothetical protein